MTPVKPLVWVVDDDSSIRWVLSKALSKAGYAVTGFADAEQVLAKLAKVQPDLIITDIRMPGLDGLELMQRARETAPALPVVVMTAHSDLDSAVASYRGGAFEYLPKPFDLDDALSLIRRALAERQTQDSVGSETQAIQASMIGEAAAMQEVFRAIGRLSHSNMTVLIRGASGTGKELVARALYENSPRADKDFIAINTAAIPAELLESELFGHERGAFTGATGLRKGRFEQANGGTLFLDEIGDMPAELQTRLLRVLSEGQFYRVGGHESISVDVRIIAATNQNLEARVRDGRFREDLYHRLNVIQIALPSLRERSEDIPLLVERFLQQAANDLMTEPKQIGADALACLKSYAWPGNVRELENLCRRLTVMAPGQVITAADLPPELLAKAEKGGAETSWVASLETEVAARLNRGEKDLLADMLPRFERVLLQTALGATGGRKQEAARRLGWGRNTLTRKLKETGLN